MSARAGPRRARACGAAAWVASLLALALFGGTGCGRYGPPTREAPHRGPEPVADTDRGESTDGARRAGERDEDRSEQRPAAEETDTSNADEPR